MTRKGCVLPSSAHRRSSPVTTTAGIMVSGKPRRAQQQQPATSPEVTPDDCSPILAWSPGSSSDPDVYLVKRKCPKSSSAPPPPAPATEPSPEAAHEQPVVQNVVRRPRQRRAVGKRCRHCTSSETSQWRPGPDGPSTLCNACGTRYRQGRLLPEYRPKASPGFRPSVHANQHKRCSSFTAAAAAAVLRRHRIRRTAAATRLTKTTCCQQDPAATTSDTSSHCRGGGRRATKASDGRGVIGRMILVPIVCAAVI
ncbi:hypothetical protein HU200_059643 [Digitaria exilis]|uniref:GATA-type domain-containing protein n=1 Tax=Digitaria exilis TaxID=1010633 RepID=A0A835DZL4_9POAL|nr:hypothetical protein HU200_059643 [Digitaria exilis]